MEAQVVMVVAIIRNRMVGGNAFASRDWQFRACGF